MTKLPFLKVQSIGNHFVLLMLSDVQALDADLRSRFSPDPSQLLIELARVLCQPRFGLGADGLLVLDRGRGEVVLRMFNADGSEDFCGNGLRCAAMIAHGHGWVGTSFQILHGDRHIQMVIHADQSIEAEFPAATFDPQVVPLSPGLDELWDHELRLENSAAGRLSSLSTGSTHTVLEVPNRPDDEVFFRVSRDLESDSQIYPDRTSVMWSYPLGPQKIGIRIWERGVGETLGCGTGSVAAAVVWMRRHGRGGEVEVVNPGGSLRIIGDSWDRPVWIRGFPEEVFHGVVDLEEALVAKN